jgi:hypothetical protein
MAARGVDWRTHTLEATLRGRVERILRQFADLRIVLFELAQQIDVADDDTQQIIEVVRHASGQIADGLSARSDARRDTQGPMKCGPPNSIRAVNLAALLRAKRLLPDYSWSPP